MPEENNKDDLKTEMSRGNFTRAAFLAASIGLPEEDVRDLRLKALWQMSAEFRNSLGTKHLAQQYGFSKQDVKEFLEKYADEKREEGSVRSLEPCYDHKTGKYLSFEVWMDQLFKNWDKLPVS